MSRRLGLTQKLALAFAVAILPVVVLAAILIQRSATLADERTRASIMGVTQAAASEADAYISTAADELAIAAPLPGVEVDQKDLELRFGRLYLERGDFLNVFAVHPDGHAMAALFREDGVMPHLVGAPLLAKVMESRAPAVSAATFPGAGRFPTILVAVPQTEPGGTVSTIVVGSLSLGRLQLGLARTASPHRVLLIDDQGNTLGDPGTDDGATSWLSGDSSSLRGRLSDDRAGVIEFRDRNGDWLAAHRSLEAAPWIIVTAIPRSTAFLPTRALVDSGAAILLAAVLGSLLAAWVLSRVVLRPLGKLAEAARGLARGNLDVRASVRSTDETSELAFALNSMADGLSATISRLEAQRAETAARAHELRRLLERTAHAQEVERGRLAADIHDSATQLMVGALFELDSLRLTIEQPETATRLSHATDRVRQAIGAMRRVMFELHPTVLAQLGLRAAVEQLASEVVAETGIECRLEVDLQGAPLDQDVEITLFRVAQEALANVRHHAYATHVTIMIRGTPIETELRITDDGRGFSIDTQSLFTEPHLGLITMSERAQSVGGVLRIVSRPGTGTTVSVVVPARQSPVDVAIVTLQPGGLK